jgi:hypothetical protein
MKGNSTMKRGPLFISILIVAALACGLSTTVATPTIPAPLPTSTTMPASETPTQIPPTQVPTQVPPTATLIPATAAPTQVPPTVQPPSSAAVEVSFYPLNLILSPALATGARGSQVPRVDGENVASWQKTPGHTELKLEGYLLQGKSLEPQIYVYPAMPYAELYPGAFESIRRMDNILYGPGGSISADQLPAVPFFDAIPVFASKIQLLSFQNGGGVRFLTEAAQYPASANNQDLFYNFQGLTRDGAYYIVAILPITAPMLAATRDGGAPLPPGGIPYPYFADPEADMQPYYASISAILDAAPEAAFTPTLGQLDSLIQSIQITP